MVIHLECSCGAKGHFESGAFSNNGKPDDNGHIYLVQQESAKWQQLHAFCRGLKSEAGIAKDKPFVPTELDISSRASVQTPLTDARRWWDQNRRTYHIKAGFAAELEIDRRELLHKLAWAINHMRTTSLVGSPIIDMCQQLVDQINARKYE